MAMEIELLVMDYSDRGQKNLKQKPVSIKNIGYFWKQVSDENRSK